MKKNKSKSTLKRRLGEAGITLIALVVTVIILLILAGVTLNLVLGNQGLLGRAQSASNIMAEATRNEMKMMGQGEKRIDEILNGQNGELPQINHEVYDKLEIGSYVYYKPSGEYTWQGSYSNSNSDDNLLLVSDLQAKKDEISEIISNLYDQELYDEAEEYEQLYSQYENDGVDMTASIWRVYSKNDETGFVELVPVDMQFDSNVPLQGARGYNNGVKLLNDACSNLFSDTEKGITARNLNVGDIKGIMTMDTLNQSQYYPYESAEEAENRNEENGDAPIFGTTWTTSYEDVRDGSGAYIKNKNYPAIYGQEAGRKIDGEYTAEGLGQSEQTAFISSDSLTANISIQPKQTYQTLYVGNEWYEDEGNKLCASILNETGLYNGKWLASRYTGNVTYAFDSDKQNRTYFGLYYLWYEDGGNIYAIGNDMMDSSSPDFINYTAEMGILPIVKMNSNLISLEQEAEIHFIENYQP